jgi:ubiquinone/menaquinone biosynthesis C-methylase UbiE
MSAAQQPVYPAPFDAVAVRYDETFTWSKIGRAQRASVWSDLAKTFRRGDRILEIGCGTGIDACFLAEGGVRVLACDSSSQMIALTRRRVRDRGHQKLVQPLLLRAEDIAALPTDESFNGAFSNFGALNCIADLRRLACDLARLLEPGSIALLCWMGSCCLWEMTWYLAHGNLDKAFRRRKRNGARARLADGAFIDVYYPPVRLLAHTFAPEFRLTSFKGVGVAVPPSYLEPWARRHPRLFELCQRADSCMGRGVGLRALGDHVLLRFERTTLEMVEG